MRIAAALLLTLLGAACTGEPDRNAFQGYVEGEFIEVAPEVGGRITALEVGRGDAVAHGAALFRIDDSEAREAVTEAEADVARAQAELENRRQGQRPAELAVIDAEVSEAEASLAMARKDFGRQDSLYRRRVVAEARLDQAREAVAVAEARLLAAERRRDVATLPARTPEIEAAERLVAAAEATLSQVRARLERYVIEAPAAGRIEDVYYEEGEVAAAGAPVLALLPEGRRKVVFFLPEAARPGFRSGRMLRSPATAAPRA